MRKPHPRGEPSANNGSPRRRAHTRRCQAGLAEPAQPGWFPTQWLPPRPSTLQGHSPPRSQYPAAPILRPRIPIFPIRLPRSAVGRILVVLLLRLGPLLDLHDANLGETERRALFVPMAAATQLKNAFVARQDTSDADEFSAGGEALVDAHESRSAVVATVLVHFEILAAGILAARSSQAIPWQPVLTNPLKASDGQNRSQQAFGAVIVGSIGPVSSGNSPIPPTGSARAEKTSGLRWRLLVSSSPTRCRRRPRRAAEQQPRTSLVVERTSPFVHHSPGPRRPRAFQTGPAPLPR